jgi:hypothetical protein
VRGAPALVRAVDAISPSGRWCARRAAATMHGMTQRIVRAITRTVRENWAPSEGHFHAGAVGRTYPCFDPACRRRSLSRWR